jgi:hypothetical protein
MSQIQNTTGSMKAEYRSIIGDLSFSVCLPKKIYYLKQNMKKAEPLGLAIAECIKHKHPELMKYDCISFVPQALTELKKDETTRILCRVYRYLNVGMQLKISTNVLQEKLKARKSS